MTQYLMLHKINTIYRYKEELNKLYVGNYLVNLNYRYETDVAGDLLLMERGAKPMINYCLVRQNTPFGIQKVMINLYNS